MDKIFLVNLYKVTNHILFKKAIDEDYPQIKQILVLGLFNWLLVLIFAKLRYNYNFSLYYQHSITTSANNFIILLFFIMSTDFLKKF